MNGLSSVDAVLPAAAPTSRALPLHAGRRWDPRLYQIATLAGLLGYGIWWLDLEVQPTTTVAIIASALATQLVCTRLWGRGIVFAFLLASAGGLVVNRAARGDVTLAFLACYAGLLVGRSLWLGEPLAIPMHRLENGALVLFSFFMISDPKTTPDSRLGRILFAALVAFGAYTVQFWLFRTNGLLWSLAVCSLLVPLIDRLSPGPRYEWSRAGSPRKEHFMKPVVFPLAVVL